MGVAILVALASVAGTHELLAMARKLGQRPHGAVALGASALVAGSFQGPELCTVGAVAIAVALPLLAGLRRADLSAAAFHDVAITLAAALTVAVPLGFMTRIRQLEAAHGLAGDLILVGLFSLWGSDGLAYYVGRAFGKHRMAPNVSPKKTWEGAVGGVLGAFLGAFLYGRLLWPAAATPLPAAVVAGVAVVVGLLGPPGDLAESVLKRSAGVKDSGTLFPGHGGLLDRVDSLLFVTPVLYYYYRLALAGS